MGMAYSKAWRIVGEAEQALGIPFNLQNAEKWFQSTKEGEKMLAAYEESGTCCLEGSGGSDGAVLWNRVVWRKFTDFLMLEIGF